ncbi:hypothetical protein [Streptomyces afghaniensis 772] [Streptomyces afghaniensis]
MAQDPYTQQLLLDWFVELDTHQAGDRSSGQAQLLRPWRYPFLLRFTTVAFGRPITLPNPFAFDLDTTDFL